jgi:hypothetical protein
VGQRRALTGADRVEIFTGRKAGWGIRTIARHVGRMPSLISREVARNSYATARDQAVHPGLALRVEDPALHTRVLADLALGRSPVASPPRLTTGCSPRRGRRTATPGGWTTKRSTPTSTPYRSPS